MARRPSCDGRPSVLGSMKGRKDGSDLVLRRYDPDDTDGNALDLPLDGRGFQHIQQKMHGFPLGVVDVHLVIDAESLFGDEHCAKGQPADLRCVRRGGAPSMRMSWHAWTSSGVSAMTTS